MSQIPHSYFNPDEPINASTLEESTNQVYFGFVKALADHQVRLTKSLLELEIPGRVFDIVVTAQWIPHPNVVAQVPGSPLSGRELVRFGQFTVLKTYRDAFLWLMADALDFWKADIPEEAQSDRRKRVAERVKQRMPDRYPDGTETPRNILDRRRKQMHLEWNELVSLVRKRWIDLQKKRQQATESEMESITLGFSVDLLYAIRRGHNAGQRRLEAIAETISSAQERIEWSALEWRKEYAVK